MGWLAMNFLNGQRSKPSPDAEDDARDAEASCVRDIFITTTDLLRNLAEQQPWRTAKFSAWDVTAIRHALRTCQQSLNLIESEFDKRE
jgi:hypothetical protein